MTGKASANSELPERPFRLGTTSFIFPDYILPNVEKLGPFFDEIELLVFESLPAAVLPSKEDIKALLHLSQTLNLTYNIHLPTDVDLTCGSLEKRQNAVDTLLGVIDLFSPLVPTTHTLHLEMPWDIKKDRGNAKGLKNWQEHTRQGVSALLSGLANPGTISIETLDYPFSHIEALATEFNLSVCMDVGHMVKFNHDFLAAFERHQFRTPVIHLHGVDFSKEPPKDHTTLDALPEKQFKKINTILEKFTGVVSLEVFSLETLNRSLIFLSTVYKNIPFPLNE